MVLKWTEKNTGLPGTVITAVVATDSQIFAAVEGEGVFMTVNEGANWSSVSSGFKYKSVEALLVTGIGILPVLMVEEFQNY
jgi:ABC-type nickel/cobalt efflux system permease component RcnA